jgi:hypothetical protein
MTHLLAIGSGAIVWAAHFAVIYGLTALACARGNAGAVPWVITIATLAGVAAAAVIALQARRHGGDFVPWLATAVAAIAAIAMIWEALAGMLARSCA